MDYCDYTRGDIVLINDTNSDTSEHDDQRTASQSYSAATD